MFLFLGWNSVAVSGFCSESPAVLSSPFSGILSAPSCFCFTVVDDLFCFLATVPSTPSCFGDKDQVSLPCFGPIILSNFLIRTFNIILLSSDVIAWFSVVARYLLDRILQFTSYSSTTLTNLTKMNFTLIGLSIRSSFFCFCFLPFFLSAAFDSVQTAKKRVIISSDNCIVTSVTTDCPVWEYCCFCLCFPEVLL